MKKYHKILHNLLLYSVFIIYLVILFVILFRTSHPFRSMNIVPLRSILFYLSGVDLPAYSEREITIYSFGFTNLVGNIVLFIPLGVYFTLFNEDKGIKKNILWVFVVSLSAELVQYIFKMGIGDIDDVILNTFGGFIGIAAYKILLVKLKDTNKVRHVIEIIAPLVGIVSFIVLFVFNKG